jgi:hypothetical protein
VAGSIQAALPYKVQLWLPLRALDAAARLGQDDPDAIAAGLANFGFATTVKV